MNSAKTIEEISSDPETDPVELDKLARQPLSAPGAMNARKNPSLPMGTILNILKEGFYDVWNNPSIPIVVFEAGISRDIEESAKEASIYNSIHGGYLDKNGMSIVSSVVNGWWGTCNEGREMIFYLSRLGEASPQGSEKHRRCVRAFISVLRKIYVGKFDAKQEEILCLLACWSKGEDCGEDAAKKAYFMLVKEGVALKGFDVMFGGVATYAFLRSLSSANRVIYDVVNHMASSGHFADQEEIVYRLAAWVREEVPSV